MSKLYLQNKRRPMRKNRRSVSRQWRGYLPTMVAGLLLGLVIAAGVWIWQQLNDPQTLPFREIRVNGQFQHLNSGQLRQTLWPHVNSGFFALKLEPLKQSLMTNPWVEEVAIRRIPGVLLVAVHEQRPIARWNDKYLINSNDQLFLTPSDAKEELPVLQGPEESEALILANFKQINALLKPLQLYTQKLTLDQSQNWELVLSNGIRVTMGNDNVLLKIQRLAHWYPQIVNDKVSAVVHIDLRYSNSIAVEFKTSLAN